ncbi:N-acetyltransferase [Actinobacteria bacterium YIM 96077]|uniref:RimJ/RimL family protein N-acetyltransferase n=1 Tax=Phytoactinopolyspora halophila TaxID=1981511 RepID=A0A329QTA7_9ACTN|nr:GNAT family protein [Phytoactinopolyspora halophila]AYY14867.1 N-acetyltransferase [Actinobacteria bacterium YIM 96077]RAW15326.1 RimJ/RimL family protein N-acetyltransferase [Phytoactinopolyspora halophila]
MRGGSRLGWPVELEHPPVGLRPLRYRDARAWSEIRARNATWLKPWEATPPSAATSGMSFRQMVRMYSAQARADEALPWAITYQGRLAGQLGVTNIVWGSARSGTVGYWVDGALAGRGIAPTALAVAVDFCFFRAELHRLEVNIRPENHASLRVVEKLGFREEGMRPRLLHIDGAWRDHRSFALTVEDVPEGLLCRWKESQRLHDR